MSKKAGGFGVVVTTAVPPCKVQECPGWARRVIIFGVLIDLCEDHTKKVKADLAPHKDFNARGVSTDRLGHLVADWVKRTGDEAREERLAKAKNKEPEKTGGKSLGDGRTDEQRQYGGGWERCHVCGVKDRLSEMDTVADGEGYKHKDPKVCEKWPPFTPGKVA